MPTFSQELTDTLNNSGELISLSARDYKKGDLLIKSHMQGERIDAIRIFRKGKLLLIAALPKDADASSSMWLGLTYVANKRQLRHTFDGDIEQFITQDRLVKKSLYIVIEIVY